MKGGATHLGLVPNLAEALTIERQDLPLEPGESGHGGNNAGGAQSWQAIWGKLERVKLPFSAGDDRRGFPAEWSTGAGHLGPFCIALLSSF